MKINDRITIKGVPKTDPDHEGRIIKIEANGVRIANMNMPFCGTYTYHFVPFEKVEIK